MAAHLSDADLGARLEEESAEAACLLGCVQAFYVYGEAREHYSSLRTLLAALRRAQAQYTQQIEVRRTGLNFEVECLCLFVRLLHFTGNIW